MEDTAVAALPDDMLLDILARVKDDDGPAALFLCAMVCKRWRRLVAGRSFLRRRCWPAPSTFAGFLGKEQQQGQGPSFVPLPPWPLPLPQQQRRRQCRLLGSFFRGAGTPSGAAPLVSRHGLVLVKLPDAGRRRVPVRAAVSLAVCDAPAATCHALPPLHCGWNQFEFGIGRANALPHNGYAVFSGADCRRRPDSSGEQSPLFEFKVIIISVNKMNRGYTVHTFSSSYEASWSKCELAVGGYGSLCQSDAVVSRGTAHWLFHDQAAHCLRSVQVNATTGEASTTTKLTPFGRHYLRYSPCLGLAADGATLLLMWMRAQGPALEIWRDDDGKEAMDGASEWVCVRTMEELKLQQPSSRRKKKEAQGRMYLYMLGARCGKLLVNDIRGRLYVVDLTTGIMEAAADWSYMRRVERGEVALLDMDWPAMFLSRLGGA